MKTVLPSARAATKTWRRCASLQLIVVAFGFLASPRSLDAGAASPAAQPFDNSLGMRLQPIPAGGFLMGEASPVAEGDEAPVHRVEISRPFFISATEVTNAQFEQFSPGHRSQRGRQGVSRADDEPVVMVTWNDAVAFCAWLSRKEGRPYRLPTEAEWEYACRAGTTTAYWTGETLPADFGRNNQADRKLVRADWDKGPEPVALRVGRTRPNPWGLYDMHGNVEEWCLDWYGPYASAPAADPVGRAAGISRVTRGGSHSTTWSYLRSANRSSALPEDKHPLLGFRVVVAPLPATQPLNALPPKIWATNVRQTSAVWTMKPEPLFAPPIAYVHGPAPGETMFHHNHQPTLAWCANGDLLATWYSCESEGGREMTIMASRLPAGAETWAPAAEFFCVADRNKTGSALLHDGRGRLYYINGCSAAQANRENLALILRTSDDNGATWSDPRLINGERYDAQRMNQPIASIFQMTDGTIVCPSDQPVRENVRHPAGAGTGLWMSQDRGETWRLSEGTIAGIHAGVVELRDGRLLAAGRGVSRIPHAILATPFSISADRGQTWTYRDSPFPPIGGGQRLILMRLREGPLLFVAFTDFEGAGKVGLHFPAAAGGAITGYGLYAAVSFDEGETWPVRRLLTDGAARELDGGAHTGKFTMDATHAEPKGYLAATQPPDGTVHLISSGLHYRFNLPWLQSLPPTEPRQR